MATDHLVIMAAGRGARMDPLTRTRPKVLLPVAGRPLIEHTVRHAVQAGFERLTCIVHTGAEEVRAHIKGLGLDLDVDFVDQGEPKGTGHAVACLAGVVAGDFVLASGDAVLSADDLRRLRAAGEVSVGGHGVDDVRPYGALDLADGRVQGISEKPPEARAGTVNTGSYLLDKDIVGRCMALDPSPRGEYELTDALTALARGGAPPALLDLPSWREAGRPWELLELQAHLMTGLIGRVDGNVAPAAELVGEVVVAAGARVLGASRIEGPAIIGPGATVGPNAYIRAATTIGARCHVGNSAEIKNSILGAHSKVPHLSYVGDSVLGEACNLGAGTQVANLKHTPRPVRVRWQGKDWLDTGRRKLGLIAGDGAKTGVNASLNPGTVLCPGAKVAAGAAVGGWIEA